MADQTAKILKRWRNSLPADAPKREVERVVKDCFPDEWEEVTSKGSHRLQIRSRLLWAAYVLGYNQEFPGGLFEVSEEGGQSVKKWQLGKILKAIDLKEQMEQVCATLGVDIQQLRNARTEQEVKAAIQAAKGAG